MGEFPWAKRNLLVRLGGNYSGGESTVLAVGERSVVTLSKGQAGLLELSFELRGTNGAVLCAMYENMFLSDSTELHDLQCTANAKEIKVWLEKRDIGLHVRFRRCTMDELGEQLKLDQERAESTSQVQGMLQQMRQQFDLPKDTSSFPGPAESFVLDWAKMNCLEPDGHLPLIDFRNLHLLDNGRDIRIRNGIQEGVRFTGCCAAFDCGVGFQL